MTGRNELCPCGSGKKYKKCCLQRAEAHNQHALEQFREEDVISELLKSSKQFEAFYQSERLKISRQIIWIKDVSLEEGVVAEALKLPSGDLVVNLRRIPARLEDATTVAHELQHLVIDTEGFPSTKSVQKDSTRRELAKTLNSMVHDPLVDSRLEKYGFDLWPNYKKETEEAILHFGKAPYPPPNQLTEIFWILVYSSLILDWELRNKAPATPSEFQRWFDVRFPSVALKGQELVTLVHKYGFDTPEHMENLFHEIIKSYRLSWLTIVNP